MKRTQDDARTIGFSVHTGWAIYVIASGSVARPEIHARGEISILDTDEERFVFHRAADMTIADAKKFVAGVREKAIRNVTRVLGEIDVESGVIVAKAGILESIEAIVASHAKIHASEGMFFRDVLRDAMTCDVRVVSPSSIDHARAAGWVRDRPWNKDHRLAAVAALTKR